MRATGVKRFKKYKRENSALRAIYSFLSDYDQDNLKLVTLISPGRQVQTFTDANEITVPKTKQRIADSKSWQRLRFKVFDKYGNACSCCGAGFLDGVKLEVDHIYPVSKYPELELEFYNLQILCNICNLGKSDVFIKDFRDEKMKRKLADIYASTYQVEKVKE
ncbi:HNH endonuclease [Salinimonas lutimaris]|uniref:HNH endonuclease n=1 Tax=Salinimonas lutimaris TaxID=914153 RepID=UPI0010BFDA52|nr:HNH endonuclease [Salinimonas lutimaris]